MISADQVSRLIELSEKLVQAAEDQSWEEMAQYDLQRQSVLNPDLETPPPAQDMTPATPEAIDRLLYLDKKVIKLVQKSTDAAKAAYIASQDRTKNSAISQYQTFSE